MKTLLKYLKPFIVGVLVSLVLLFVQARMDLNLPNYMSNIINIGLQKSGVSESTPKAISENSFRLVKIFVTDNNKKVLNNNYKLILKGDSNYIKKYSLVKTSNIYVLKDSKTNMDRIFGDASATMISFFKDSNPNKTNSNSGMAADLSKVYPVIPKLEMLPEAAFNAARESSKKYDDMLKTQMASSLTQTFYHELGIDLGKIQTDYIIDQGIIMIIIALLGGFASILVGLFASKIAAGVAQNMRKDVFDKVLNFSNKEYDAIGPSSLITRTTNDITQVSMLVFMGIRIVCYAPIMGIGGIIMALQKSTSMSWIIALAVLVLMSLVAFVFIFAEPKFKIMQTLIDKINLVVRENLNGIMVVRAFANEPFETKRFAKANHDISKNSLFIGYIMSALMPIISFIMSGAALLIVWVGAHQIEQAGMPIGDMLAFMQYTMQIIMAFLMVTMIFIFVPRAAVSLKRIAEVLDMDIDVKEPTNIKDFDKKKKGLLEFKNVSFKYQNADDEVLDNISFACKPGTTTAIIGSTGCGKSTLINLIPRFYDVTKGSILVNGTDIRNVSLKTLRDVIGYVPQKASLLSGSITSNLKYGKKNAKDDEIKEAAKVAQADFINDLKEGFDYHIAGGATNVSGGQKQRLSIARALVKKPDIYLFDDTFSALDFKTDSKLRSALKGYTKNATILIVAQRVSTIMSADQIIVLEKGQIVGIGKHKDLLKNCPTYLEIVASQLKKEEY